MKRMKLKKMMALALMACLTVGAVAGCGKKSAKGNKYPNHAIQMIVPVKAGGDTDSNARLLASFMEKDLKTSIPVVNVAGSSGTIGMEQVKNAKPDGYTALFYHAEAMMPEIAGLINYQLDAYKMAGICLKANTTLLVTHKDTPYKTLPEFIKYAKENPGKVEFGMAVGGYPQLIGLALQKQAGIKLKMVDIGGNSPKIAALAGHNTDVINVEYFLIKDYLKTGEFVPLALLSSERNPLFPDIPTAKEQGLNNMEFGKFFFVAFPKDTPDEIVNAFSASMKKAVENPEFVKKAQDSFALTPTYMGPADATKYAQSVYKDLLKYKDDFRNAGKAK
jgi:tripartite-type tricarboxylate transporter receptor subunit TctC